MNTMIPITFLSLPSVLPYTVSDEFCESVSTTLDPSQRYVAVSNGSVFVMVRELCDVASPVEFAMMLYLVPLRRGLKWVPFHFDHSRTGAGNPEALQTKVASCGSMTVIERGETATLGKAEVKEKRRLSHK